MNGPLPVELDDELAEVRLDAPYPPVRTRCRLNSISSVVRDLDFTMRSAPLALARSATYPMASSPVFAMKTCPPFLLTDSANLSTTSGSAAFPALMRLSSAFIVSTTTPNSERPDSRFSRPLDIAPHSLSWAARSAMALSISELSFSRAVAILTTISIRAGARAARGGHGRRTGA